MKMNIASLTSKAAAILLTGLALAQPALAGGAKAGPTPNHHSHDMTVDSVGTDSVTINGKSYTVSKFTDILVNGSPGKLSDIQAGMTAELTLEDATSLAGISVKASSAPESTPTPAKKKKAPASGSSSE